MANCRCCPIEQIFWQTFITNSDLLKDKSRTATEIKEMQDEIGLYKIVEPRRIEMANDNLDDEINKIYQRVFKVEWDKLNAQPWKEEEEQKKEQEEQIKKLVGVEVKKLEVKPGDVIIVQLTEKVPAVHLTQFLKQLRALIGNVGISVEYKNLPAKETHIFVVPYGVTIEAKPKRLLRPQGE